ncbi:hypothetical protein [Kingella oralis]|uniref:hypothetical protein n=1 Tax=Kingella oralis TaxID=505 RepID=UPI002D801CE0|nr:hypothetical protein [Kingella oralis]
MAISIGSLKTSAAKTNEMGFGAAKPAATTAHPTACPNAQRQPENPITGFRLPLFARGLHIEKENGLAVFVPLNRVSS